VCERISQGRTQAVSCWDCTRRLISKLQVRRPDDMLPNQSHTLLVALLLQSLFISTEMRLVQRFSKARIPL